MAFVSPLVQMVPTPVRVGIQTHVHVLFDVGALEGDFYLLLSSLLAARRALSRFCHGKNIGNRVLDMRLFLTVAWCVKPTISISPDYVQGKSCLWSATPLVKHV